MQPCSCDSQRALNEILQREMSNHWRTEARVHFHSCNLSTQSVRMKRSIPKAGLSTFTFIAADTWAGVKYKNSTNALFYTKPKLSMKTHSWKQTPCVTVLHGSNSLLCIGTVWWLRWMQVVAIFSKKKRQCVLVMAEYES